MTNAAKFLRSALAMAALLVAAGCGQGLGSGSVPMLQPGTPISASEPGTAPIPFPEDRVATGLAEHELSGDGPEEYSPEAVVVLGNALLLDASASASPLFATYGSSAAGESLDSVNVQLSSPQTTGAFIGLANYATGRWDFSGPFTSSRTLGIAGGNYLSPAGNVFVNVMVPAGQRAIVTGLTFRTVTGPNAAPVAALKADVLHGPAPLLVHFDASDSTDADGSIRDYAWDFDGDGDFEEHTDGPLADHTFPGAGDLVVTVRVTDDAGARSRASVALTVQGWLHTRLDASLGNSASICLAELNGKPAVAYALAEAGGFKQWLALGNSPSGTTGWERQALVLDGAAHSDLSLAQVRGCPAVSYHNSQNELKYTFSSDSAGHGSWTTLTVGTTGSSAGSIQLAEVNGHPAVSYYNSTAGNELRYGYSLWPDGHADWQTVTLDTGVGGFSSLAVVAGRPAIAYNKNSTLFYSTSTDADGAADWQSQPVTTLSSYGYAFSLASVGGHPALAVNDETNPFRYIANSTADGSGAWSSVLVQRAASLPMLVELHGLPVVTYFYSQLDLARGAAPDGSGSWAPETVDAGTEYGPVFSAAVIDGHLAVAYQQTSYTVDYAVRFD